MTKQSEEALLDRAEELLDSLREAHDRGSLQSFGLVSEDGRTWTRINGWCMAGLKYAHEDGVSLPARFLVDWSLSNYQDANYKRDYIDWVVNDSVWADVHVLKDPGQIVKKGTILDLRAGPMNYVVQANVMIRYLREFPKWIDTWTPLSHYMDKHAACVFADRLSSVGNVYYPNSTSLSNSNHSFLSSSMISKEGLTRLMNRDKAEFKKFRPATCNFSFGLLSQTWQTDKEFQSDLDFEGVGTVVEVRGRKLNSMAHSTIDQWAAQLIEKNYLGDGK